MDTSTGIDLQGGQDDLDEGDDDGQRWRRSPSPASSVSFLAASFVQRVNNFVGSMAPKSPSLPSDAELEAEGERERERSRREAEAIMFKEMRERKLVEERVLEMLDNTKSLPPPPVRSQTLPNPPSPVGSQKDVKWWQAAKNKLTPSKEPLTPAQQIIQDSKARDKEQKKITKVREKEVQRAQENEWPAKPESKYADPAFANLQLPVAPPTRKPVPSSPSSPTPSRPSLLNMPPNLTPSPMRTTDSISSSPSREAPPLYVQFSAQGTLDVPGTLITIAKRFEKLEKWTVGHVRALEDRMNDVERWLVDKEKEKQDTSSVRDPSNDAQFEMQEMREEIAEVQGRVGELGREMARMATSASNLSSGPKSQVASVFHAAVPSTSSILVQQHTGPSPPVTPHRRLSSTARDSTSPPMMSSRRTPSGTRLPYPQGDYTSPTDMTSPTNSPPNSLGASARNKPLSISGLPNVDSSILKIEPFGVFGTSPAATSSPPPAVNGLPPPRRPVSPRQTSISPTPRKRYTVALGDRIVAGSPSIDDLSSNAAIPEPPRRTGTPKSFTRPLGSSGTPNGQENLPDEDSDFGGETIGKSTGSRLANSTTFSSVKGDYKSDEPTPLSTRRLRTQSAYGFSNIAGSGSTNHTPARSGTSLPSVEPLKPKMRSKSTERLDSSPSTVRGSGTGDGMVSAVGGSTKFVDPLILRKQSRDSVKPIAMPRPLSGKIPVEKLVAFFDGERR